MTTNFKNRYDSRQPTKGVEFTEESQALQSEYPATTIDYYIKKYTQTGMLGDPARAQMAEYLDVSDVGDFAEMQERVISVRNAFMELPAEERRKFGDDPTAWAQAVYEAKLAESVQSEPTAEPEPVASESQSDDSQHMAS